MEKQRGPSLWEVELEGKKLDIRLGSLLSKVLGEQLDSSRVLIIKYMMREMH